MHQRILRPILSSILAAVLISGCASNPEEQKEWVDSEAGLGELPEPEWQTPIWERWENAEQAREEAALVGSTVPEQPGSGQRLANLALIGELPAAETMLETLAIRHGFRLINQRTLEEALSQVEACQNIRSMACAKALGAFPGARLVVVIENGNAVVLDPSSGAEYGATPVNDAEALMDLAADRSELGPWAMRSFRGDDQQLYLAVGQANGMEQGQTLAVHEEGRLVRSPTGQPVGWRPGNKIGEVRISGLLGPALSTLETVSGEAPGDKNVLLLQD